MLSQAFDAYDVANIEEVQLYTNSHDQGAFDFPEAGSFSWFDLMILESADATTPKVVNGRTLVWSSHHNSLDAKGVDWLYRGKIFDKSHEMLQSIEVCSITYQFHRMWPLS